MAPHKHQSGCLKTPDRSAKLYFIPDAPKILKKRIGFRAEMLGGTPRSTGIISLKRRDITKKFLADTKVFEVISIGQDHAQPHGEVNLLMEKDDFVSCDALRSVTENPRVSSGNKQTCGDVSLEKSKDDDNKVIKCEEQKTDLKDSMEAHINSSDACSSANLDWGTKSIHEQVEQNKSLRLHEPIIELDENTAKYPTKSEVKTPKMKHVHLRRRKPRKGGLSVANRGKSGRKKELLVANEQYGQEDIYWQAKDKTTEEEKIIHNPTVEPKGNSEAYTSLTLVTEQSVDTTDTLDTLKSNTTVHSANVNTERPNLSEAAVEAQFVGKADKIGASRPVSKKESKSSRQKLTVEREKKSLCEFETILSPILREDGNIGFPTSSTKLNVLKKDTESNTVKFGKTSKTKSKSNILANKETNLTVIRGMTCVEESVETHFRGCKTEEVLEHDSEASKKGDAQKLGPVTRHKSKRVLRTNLSATASIANEVKSKLQAAIGQCKTKLNSETDEVLEHDSEASKKDDAQKLGPVTRHKSKRALRTNLNATASIANAVMSKLQAATGQEMSKDSLSVNKERKTMCKRKPDSSVGAETIHSVRFSSYGVKTTDNLNLQAIACLGKDTKVYSGNTFAEIDINSDSVSKKTVKSELTKTLEAEMNFPTNCEFDLHVVQKRGKRRRKTTMKQDIPQQRQSTEYETYLTSVKTPPFCLQSCNKEKLMDRQPEASKQDMPELKQVPISELHRVRRVCRPRKDKKVESETSNEFENCLEPGQRDVYVDTIILRSKSKSKKATGSCKLQEISFAKKEQRGDCHGSVDLDEPKLELASTRKQNAIKAEREDGVPKAGKEKEAILSPKESEIENNKLRQLNFENELAAQMSMCFSRGATASAKKKASGSKSHLNACGENVVLVENLKHFDIKTYPIRQQRDKSSKGKTTSSMTLRKVSPKDDNHQEEEAVSPVKKSRITRACLVKEESRVDLSKTGQQSVSGQKKAPARGRKRGNGGAAKKSTSTTTEAVTEKDILIKTEAGTKKKSSTKAVAGESALMFVGAHCSIAGGVSNAVAEAVAMGAKAFALFVRNGRTWKLNPVNQEEAEKFKEACKEHNYPPHLVLPHGSYLLNCGSSNPDVLQKSRETLVHELKICEALGLTLYNFHPGSACGNGSRDQCIQTIADSINIAHKKTNAVKTVIENMSCQGQTIGGKLEELREIIDKVEDKSRVGVCLDTCHAFAAGFDLSSEEGYQNFMKDFENIVGLKYLSGVHLNDSKGEVGCHLDRHENIGKGKIGLAGFRRVMNDCRLANIPMILETPPNNYAAEIGTLYSLEGEIM